MFSNALGGEAQGLPQGLRELGQAVVDRLARGVSGNGWEVFEGTDIALLVCALVVLGLTVLAMGAAPGINARPDVVAGLIAPAGLAATMLVVWKLVDQPDPRELFALEHGAYIALAGALTMALGGWAAGAQRRVR